MITLPFIQRFKKVKHSQATSFPRSRYARMKFEVIDTGDFGENRMSSQIALCMVDREGEEFKVLLDAMHALYLCHQIADQGYRANTPSHIESKPSY